MESVQKNPSIETAVHFVRRRHVKKKERQGVVFLTNKITLLDGAMGTQLQKRGIHQAPESLNISQGEIIEQIQRAYVQSGSDLIYSNTFGANGRNYPDPEELRKIIHRGLQIAKKAARGKAKVAFDIGPLGELLEPMGTMSFERAYKLFEQNIQMALEEGFDLVVIETMSSLLELRAAILAVKEHFTGPLFTTMTFEKDGRTFSGVCPQAFALMADKLGVDALGVNCSLGPFEMKEILQAISQVTNKPLIVKANAGLPDEEGKYHLEDGLFIDGIQEMLDLGVQYIGGCCGTTEKTIQGLAKHFKGRNVPVEKTDLKQYVASSSRVVALDQTRYVGEVINPTGKDRLKESLEKKNMEEVLRLGVLQEQEGADLLDVNVSLPGTDEVYLLRKASLHLQALVDLPLQLDSSNVEALEEALIVTPGRPVINSVNGTQESLRTVLPLAKKYGAMVVGLTLDEDGIPKTAEKRIQIAEKIVQAAESYGLEKRDVLIDPLVLTIASNKDSAKVALETIEKLTEKGYLTTMGTSNISFGLPKRSLVNASFLQVALAKGCTMPIVNPLDQRIQEVMYTHRLLMGQDEKAMDYIAFMENKKEEAPLQEDQDFSPYQAMRRSQKTELLNYVKTAIQKRDPMEIISEDLIPALDAIGQDYEKKEIYLPQLIGAASAAQEAFLFLRDQLKVAGGVKGEKILLATVQGDIHDIGKNIAKVLLENYGYDVYDLGRDVPKEEILKMVEEEDIHLVGLSALMTTTVASMEETIQLLKEKRSDIKIMVGGAVLTQAYAHEIGAHYYCKDAKEDIEIAKDVFKD